jgi:hypothetical protein
MKKEVICTFVFFFILFSLLPGLLRISINGEDTHNDLNVCLSKENLSVASDNLTIVLVINNKYMTVNGTKKEIDPGRDAVPVIVKGRTLVPIRAIIEEMGGTVDSSATDKKVTIKL